MKTQVRTSKPTAGERVQKSKRVIHAIKSINTVAEEGRATRRRCEATMAGGIKVSVWSAVGPWPRCWGAGAGGGGGGAAWLLLVVVGCVVCGSGTTGAAAAQGSGSRALNVEKWFLIPRVRPVTRSIAGR